MTTRRRSIAAPGAAVLGAAVLRAAVLGAAVLGAVAGVTAAPAAAHPHVWIDLHSTALMDASGRVEAVRIEWLFDRFYSSFALEDLDADRDGKVSDGEAEIWAQTAFANIADAGYFAELLVDGRNHPAARAEAPAGRWVDDRLFMSFVIRLDAPADPRKVAVGYMSYDPMFYIDIRHPDGAAKVEGPGADGCTADIGRSEPSPEVVASAAALDRDEEAAPGLGRLFADYVKVTCR